MAPIQNAMAAFFLSVRMPLEGRVLDAGCGTGLFGVVMKAMRRLGSPELVGCDVYAPPHLEAVPKGVYDVLVCCDIAYLPFRERCFSGVAAVEVIEHLDRERGLRALNEFERVSRGIVALTTPRGYRVKRDEDGNPFQTHLSGWSAAEFRRLGFKVRFLPGMGNRLWVFVPFALTYLTGIWALTLICFKKIR